MKDILRSNSSKVDSLIECLLGREFLAPDAGDIPPFSRRYEEHQARFATKVLRQLGQELSRPQSAQRVGYYTIYADRWAEAMTDPERFQQMLDDPKVFEALCDSTRETARLIRKAELEGRPVPSDNMDFRALPILDAYDVMLKALAQARRNKGQQSTYITCFLNEYERKPQYFGAKIQRKPNRPKSNAASILQPAANLANTLVQRLNVWSWEVRHLRKSPADLELIHAEALERDLAPPSSPLDDDAPDEHSMVPPYGQFHYCGPKEDQEAETLLESYKEILNRFARKEITLVPCAETGARLKQIGANRALRDNKDSLHKLELMLLTHLAAYGELPSAIERAGRDEQA